MTRRAECNSSAAAKRIRGHQLRGVLSSPPSRAAVSKSARAEESCPRSVKTWLRRIQKVWFVGRQPNARGSSPIVHQPTIEKWIHLGLVVQATMLDDEIDYLLRSEPGVDAEVRERHVVRALALIREVMPLPEPGTPKSQVGFGPMPNQLVRYFGVQIQNEPGARNTLYGRRRDACRLRLGSRNSKVIKIIFELRQVVSAVVQRVNQNRFRRRRVLEVVQVSSPFHLTSAGSKLGPIPKSPPWVAIRLHGRLGTEGGRFHAVLVSRGGDNMSFPYTSTTFNEL